MQVTHDAVGALSNERYFSREVSLCRETLTVMWRYWITVLVVWVWKRAERRLYFLPNFFFGDLESFGGVGQQGEGQALSVRSKLELQSMVRSIQ